jgi:transcriptional regulator with XRE-family HTH domain
MDLSTWMTLHRKIDIEVADAAGVTRPYISRIRQGLVNPSLSVALRIWNYTNREVALEQLLPRAERPSLVKPPVRRKLAKRPSREVAA